MLDTVSSKVGPWQPTVKSHGNVTQHGYISPQCPRHGHGLLTFYLSESAGETRQDINVISKIQFSPAGNAVTGLHGIGSMNAGFMRFRVVLGECIDRFACGRCLAAPLPMTFPSPSVRRYPFDESRMTSRLCHGSSITAHKPIRIANGPATTFPPSSTNLLIAAGTEATKRSVSIGRSSVCSTSSASESGSLNPAAESSRQISS
jgi:hypothetical protein